MKNKKNKKIAKKILKEFKEGKAEGMAKMTSFPFQESKYFPKLKSIIEYPIKIYPKKIFGFHNGLPGIIEEMQKDLEKAEAENKKLEVGKWYKQTHGIEFLVNYQDDHNGNYGFWNGEEFSNSIYFGSYLNGKCKEATPKEIETALIAEAKKIGFVAGAKFKSSISEKGQIRTVNEWNWNFYPSENSLNISTPENEWQYNQSNPTIFKDGKWAEIIEKSYSENHPKEDTLDSIHDKVIQWGTDRGFYDKANGTTAEKQFGKLIEEVGEIAGNLARGRDTKDDIGDALVVLSGLAKLQGTTLLDCFKVAYDDIKDRKGKMVKGVFIKESDLIRSEPIEML